LSGYSAHADQADLVSWVKQIPERPSKIKLVHGEKDAQNALYKALHLTSSVQVLPLNETIKHRRYHQ